jgi:pimeloyl-ACP methyl ester carboxylesterase
VLQEHHLVPNGDGWRLSLYQSWEADKLVAQRRPVLIVPGYGMNSFIFSYHPSGPSLEGFLVDQGFEVWRVDFRGQGESVSDGGADDYSLEDLALTDLGAALAFVLAHTRTGADRVDVIGASLGGTMMFVHAVVRPGHPMGSLVSVGGPVRWVAVHPAIRLAFSSPVVAGLLPLRGTRRLAELVLPLLVRHAPWVLSIYINPALTDTRAAREMVRTVEDPNRHVNRQIACWIRDKDLVIRGLNVSESLGRITRPLLCILAHGDGVVPRPTAAFPFDRAGSARKALLEVGDRELAMAHADMFIADVAHERVFQPLARWLVEQNERDG